MQLYFYFLEDGVLTLDSCEVVEKPKTYRPVKGKPKCFYGQFIRKDDIGKITGCSLKALILSERDDRKACGLFSKWVKTQIEINKDNILHIEKKNKELRETMEMLEDSERNL